MAQELRKQLLEVQGWGPRGKVAVPEELLGMEQRVGSAVDQTPGGEVLVGPSSEAERLQPRGPNQKRKGRDC
jgi:hypothetical protein